MIRLHHLEESRSQRIVWLLEELGLDYELVHYERDAATRRAPPALRDVHPLGKSPLLEDGDVRLPESGAIVEHLVARYGMFPLLLDMFLDMAGEGAAGLKQHVRAELDLYLSYMDAELAEREWFAGDAFTAADVLMGFAIEFAATRADLTRYPNLARYLERIHARPAHRRAIEKGRR